MPNWCSNNLYIKGDREVIADFIQRVTVPEGAERNKSGNKYDILGRLYPTPQELRDATAGHFTAEPNANWANLLAEGKITQEWHDELVERNAKGYATAQANIKKYGYADWYDWCNANWGSKWGDCDTDLVSEEGNDQIEFSFSSAWSPPIEGIAHISTMFPTLTFHLSYQEEGMDFYGVTTFDGTGDYIDNCESISELDGMKEIDWDSDDYIEVMEENHEILLNAQEKMLMDAGG